MLESPKTFWQVWANTIQYHTFTVFVFILFIYIYFVWMSTAKVIGSLIKYTSDLYIYIFIYYILNCIYIEKTSSTSHSKTGFIQTD